MYPSRHWMKKSCIFVCWIHRIRVDGSRIRKGKVADSKISGYVRINDDVFAKHLPYK